MAADMTPLPPPPVERASLLVKEAAALFGMKSDCFRKWYLDTGIIVKDFTGRIPANQCTVEFANARILELGLSFKTSPVIKLKPFKP